MAFNQAIKDGTISGPIVLSRDHHDVSGTKSTAEHLEINIFKALTLRSAKRVIFMMVLPRLLIWLFKIVLAMRRVAQHGWHYTMVVVLVGEKL